MSFVSYGQDRVNRTKLSFEQSSQNLTNSVGWKYNKELGEWVDYENVISNDKNYKDKYKILSGAYMMSQSQQTFNDVTIKTLTFNGIKYYVLLINKWSGRYKYPSIREDWRSYKYTSAYLMEEIEYKKLVNFNEPKFKYVIQYDQEFEEYNETKFLDLIQTEISRVKSKYEGGKGYEWILPIKKINDKVRFLTPTLDGSVYNINNSKYWTPLYDMEKEYFETDVINFTKLFLK